MSSIDERKQLARKSARSLRKAVPEADRAAKSTLICTHIASSAIWAGSSVVLTYFPAGSEVDVSALIGPLRHREVARQSTKAPSPKTFGAPIVEGENMRFGYVRRENDGSPQTIVGPYGLREPDGPPVTLDKVGLVLIPLLAFDALGNRLGSGKGFYDRFLAANPELVKRAVLLGVAFGVQRVEDLPVESHDYQLNGVVTEAGITSFRQRVRHDPPRLSSGGSV